jgi:hypothetical protein
MVVLSCHAVPTGLNYRHIMTGSVLLSSLAEGKCTKLTLRRTNIPNWDDVSNYSNISLLSVRLEIGDVSRKMRLPVALMCPRPKWNSLQIGAATSPIFFLRFSPLLIIIQLLLLNHPSQPPEGQVTSKTSASELHLRLKKGGHLQTNHGRNGAHINLRNNFHWRRSLVPSGLAVCTHQAYPPCAPWGLHDPRSCALTHIPTPVILQRML